MKAPAIVLIITFIFLLSLAALKEKRANHCISLPEEYELISHDAKHPDTLIGHYDKDGTLVIGFKH